MNHKKTFAAIKNLQEVEIELHRLKNALEMANKALDAQRTWVGLMRGVRVEGDTIVITVKGGNDEARCLCGELINEMEMHKEKNT